MLQGLAPGRGCLSGLALAVSLAGCGGGARGDRLGQREGSASTDGGAGAAPCVPFRPGASNWSSLPTSRPPSVGGTWELRSDALRPSVGGDFVYSIGVWIESGHPRRQILRSGDLGATWCALQTDASIADLVLAPSAPDAMYAVTVPAVSGGPEDVLRTTDGGATWAVAHGGLPEPFDPRGQYPTFTVGNDPAIVWFQGTTALYLSKDGADSWHEVALPTPKDPADLVTGQAIIDPRAPERLLFEGLRAPLGGVPLRPFVITSGDWGATWTERELPTPVNPDALDAFQLAVDPASALYVGLDTAQSPLYASYAIWRSKDWGASWSSFSTPVGSVPSTLQSASAAALFVYSQTDPNPGLYETTNQGAAWNLVSVPTTADALVSLTPTSLIGKTVTDVTGTVGMTGTFSLVATADGGASWKTHQLVGQADSLVASEVAPHPLWINSGSFRSDDGLDWVPSLGSYPSLMTDGADPNVAYASSAYGANAAAPKLTEDRGRSWQTMSSPTSRPLNPLAACPPPTSCLYALDTISTTYGDQFLYRSDDHGRSWLGPWPWTNYDTKSPVAVSATEGRHMLQGRTDGVYETRDGGATWIWRKLGVAVVSIAFVSDAGVVALTDKLQVLRSADGGTTWAPSPNQLPTGVAPQAVAVKLVHSASHPETLFIITRDPKAPVFRSRDSGATWAPEPLGGDQLGDYYGQPIVLDIADTGCGFLAAVQFYGLVQFQ
jgi:photosystem II stability/assembly factor-like uncharacterized protein